MIDLIEKAAGNEELVPGRHDIEDFARIFILFLFNTVLFPNAHMYVPAYLVHYVDNLETIDEYAWGEAVHNFLVQSLIKMEQGRRYIEGCTFGLVVSL